MYVVMPCTKKRALRSLSSSQTRLGGQVKERLGPHSVSARQAGSCKRVAARRASVGPRDLAARRNIRKAAASKSAEKKASLAAPRSPGRSRACSSPQRASSPASGGEAPDMICGCRGGPALDPWAAAFHMPLLSYLSGPHPRARRAQYSTGRRGLFSGPRHCLLAAQGASCECAPLPSNWRMFFCPAPQRAPRARRGSPGTGPTCVTSRPSAPVLAPPPPPPAPCPCRLSRGISPATPCARARGRFFSNVVSQRVFSNVKELLLCCSHDVANPQHLQVAFAADWARDA